MADRKSSEWFQAHWTFSFFPLLSVAIWSGNQVITKAAATSIEPGAIAFYRWLLAGLLLCPFLMRNTWRKRLVVLANWPKLALLGSLGMAIYQSLAYLAAQTTTATNMGVIVSMMPIFTIFLARFFYREPFNFRIIGAALLSLSGLLILLGHGGPLRSLVSSLHVGDGLMILAVLANALYGVLLRRWKMSLSNWEQLFVQIWFGILLLFPFWLLSPASPLTATNLPLILYAALFASICAPISWMKAVRHLGASRAGLYMNLLPVFVAVAAWLFLNEQIRLYHLCGGGLALLGVMLGQEKKRGDGHGAAVEL